MAILVNAVNYWIGKGITMRTNDVLIYGFEDIQVLQQYLYMSEEHFVEVVNEIGVHLQFRMGSDLEYRCKNMNFPYLPDMHSEMSNGRLLAIIAQLKETPAVEFPSRFETRWEEIKMITMTNVTQNKMKMRR